MRSVAKDHVNAAFQDVVESERYSNFETLWVYCRMTPHEIPRSMNSLWCQPRQAIQPVKLFPGQILFDKLRNIDNKIFPLKQWKVFEEEYYCNQPRKRKGFSGFFFKETVNGIV